MPPVPNADVADFLADREGLVGSARERFRRLLSRYRGFGDRSRAVRLIPPIVLVVLLGLGGLLCEWPTDWSRGLVWIEYYLLSAFVLGRLRSEQCKWRQIDRETHWEAYRLFLRPVILNEHPGLLDRNVAAGQHAAGALPLQPVPTFRRAIHERGPDFWWSILCGCSLGTGAVVVLRQRSPEIPWSTALPAVGALLGLMGWLVWRRCAYLLVKLDSRLTDS